MRILHGLQVISNSHHSDVFFLSFDLILIRATVGVSESTKFIS